MKKCCKQTGTVQNVPNPKMAQKALTEKQGVAITRKAGKHKYK